MKFSIRLSAIQARLLLLLANVLLALGIPAFAAYNYYLNVQREVDEPAVFHGDLTKFEPRNVPLTAPENPANQMTSVAQWLDPPPPESIDINDEPPPPPIEIVEALPEEGTLPVGPLEEDWLYAGYIIRENPIDNIVILAKKTPQKAGKKVKPPRSRKRPRAKNKKRPRRGRGAIAKKMEPTISFRVGDRHFTDEAYELDFFVHAADHEKLVYWMSGSPGEKFALTYTSKSSYLENPDEGLVPAEVKEGEEEEKKPKLIKRPMDWEPRREKDYWLIAEGKKKIIGSSFDEGTDEDADGGEPSATPQGRSTDPQGARSGPRKMTNDDRKMLRDAIKEIPKEAKRKLLEGLQGSKK